MYPSARLDRPGPKRPSSIVRFGTVLALLATALGVGAVGSATPASASSVTSAVFSGGAGTVSVGGTLYAKQGATLTLTVATSNDTQCVDVAGAFTAHDQSPAAKSSWTFTTSAPAGNGVQGITATASPGFNSQNKCTGSSSSLQASYTVDNTGPLVAAALTPAANTAGWNNTDVTVKWTATDAGSGVAAPQPFKTESVTSNGIVTLTAPRQSDRLGNTGADGTVTVRVDKAKPTISGTQQDNGDGTVTVSFTCDDSNSGGGQSSGIATCVADGTTPASSSKTVPGGTIVTGTATDNAGNTTTAAVTATAAPTDKTAPTISHSVSPAPNAAGWNKADATVTFTCADETGGSGLASCVADGGTTASKTISTETNGTQVSGTAKDKAGNTATDSVTVKLDKTNPTITATANGTKNAAGWYKDDVTVSYAASDALSGISGVPAPKVLTEGADQSASATVTDAAGNSASAGVTGINVDKTAPVLTGSFPSGWQKGDVTVTWTCTDALSKVATAPANDVVKGEGSNLTSTASCADNAGNSTTETVTGIKIDRTAPNTGISGPSNTWVNGTVTVTLSPTDNGSGVASTTYSVDGGAQQTGTSLKLDTEGDHTVTFFSTDVAGNAEAATTVRVMIDKTAPTIGHVFTTPLGYEDGAWTNQDVSVRFDCADQGGSGVAGCTGAATVSTEGTAQKVTGTATDGAGNTSTDTALVSIDKTAPVIAGAPDRAAGANGWYDHDVTVSFTATDDRSGVASTTADKVLVQGADQSVTGTATDAAGNSASDTVSGINIDKTAPVLTGSFPSGWHTGDVTVAWTCTDPLSGPSGQPADSKVTGEGGNLSATATCTDKAGNSTTTTVSGIQIDRTAPTTAASVSGDLTNGWYSADVSFTLKGSDNLSGVVDTFFSVDGGVAQPYTGAVSIDTDGTHTVTYWSTDKAGKVEDKAGNSITLKLDKTSPALDGKATTAPNAKGWYRADVTVAWTCSDTGSGIDGACPADSIVTGEGDSLDASASVSDLAGNVTKAKVGPLKIDVTAPTTTASVPQLPASGWYRDAVQVTLTGGDNLSGLDATYYAVDGAAAQTYSGAFLFGTEGTHQITFWSKDNAGNVEAAGAPITLSIDKTAPRTSVVVPSTDSGWYVTSGIPVAFEAADALSGIRATYYTIDGGATQTYGKPFTADLSTGVHTITYWSVDIAGNDEAKDSVKTTEVKVDTIAPTITADRTPAANSFGWNSTDVKVTFTCTDADSGVDGIAGCGPDQTVASEGKDQAVQGDTQDVAGNKSSVTVEKISIDKTKPSLTGAATGDSNGGEWYRGDVSIAWTGVDGLSQIDPATQPANSTIKGEGRNLGASAKIADKAGNEGSGSVTGINIDRTPLEITAQLPNGKNAAGWYRGDVTVGFSCTDPNLADGSAGSGVANCPSDAIVSGDGANQSVTSAAAKDLAGNESTKTVSGINIDGHEPQTKADNQCTATNGYCTGATATVVLSASDVGPSGVKEIRYSVNGGTEQVAAGAGTSVSVPLSGTGAASVRYYAVDVAGNIEPTNTATLKYDNIAPTVTHTVNPKPNASDWNNSDVTVHFDATDTDPGSGVVAGSVTPDQVITTEGKGTVVAGSAKDTAGNTGTDSVTVNLDKTKPSINGAVIGGTMGKNGWYVTPVKVRFTCADALSLVASCQDDVTLSNNGAGQSANGSAKDNADNIGTGSVNGIDIDNENPTITKVNVSNGFYKLGAVPAATCDATDSFSGLDTCKVTVTGGTANGVGTFNWTATAIDRAGNSVSQSGTYKVTYQFNGFLQPINDTAHQVGTSTSVFKAGSTIPVKFQLKNAAGTPVQSASAPVWLTPVKGGAMSLPVDETVQTVTADSGSTFRYDATAAQYIYNWKTGSTGGSYWQIGVRLDDGQTYYVNIGLR